MSSGKRVRAQREALGLTQPALAKKLGTTRLTVLRLENGQTKDWFYNPAKLAKLARALRTTIEELRA